MRRIWSRAHVLVLLFLAASSFDASVIRLVEAFLVRSPTLLLPTVWKKSKKRSNASEQCNHGLQQQSTTSKSNYPLPGFHSVPNSNTYRTQSSSHRLFATTNHHDDDGDDDDDHVVRQQQPFNNNNNKKPKSRYDTIIAGGGPAGLLAAIALAQVHGPNHSIAVCERRSTIPTISTYTTSSTSDAGTHDTNSHSSTSSEEFSSSSSTSITRTRNSDDNNNNSDDNRFYLIGLGHRGQGALSHFGVQDDFLRHGIEIAGRCDYDPVQNNKHKKDQQTQPPSMPSRTITLQHRTPPTRVVSRDTLVGLLHTHIVEQYIHNNNNNSHQIDLLYGYSVEPIEFGTADPNSVKVHLTPTNDNDDDAPPKSTNTGGTKATSATTTVVTADFLLGADGAARNIAHAMQKVDAIRYHKYVPRWKRHVLGLLFFNIPVVSQHATQPHQPFRLTTLVDKNPRVYKSLPITLPPQITTTTATRKNNNNNNNSNDDKQQHNNSENDDDNDDWPLDLNYSARTSRITLEALPTDSQGNFCALLLMHPDDELAKQQHNSNSDNVDDDSPLEAYFKKTFPQFANLLESSAASKAESSSTPATNASSTTSVLSQVARKPVSRLPVFAYAGPHLHLTPYHNDTATRTLLVGDAAHTVKPYFGLGANTALEDVQILADVLRKQQQQQQQQSTTTITTTNNTTRSSEVDVPQAVAEFSRIRAADAKAMVQISSKLDQPSGSIAFFTQFVGPLILDSIFHKLAPRVFAPNMFGMFQEKNIGFRQIQLRKRRDRVLQLAVLGTVFSGMYLGSRALLHHGRRFVVGRIPPVVMLATVVPVVSFIIMVGIAKQSKDNRQTKSPPVEIPTATTIASEDMLAVNNTAS